MNKGDFFYRRIDGKKCIVIGFFYLHTDNTMSPVTDKYKSFSNLVFKHGLDTSRINILFHDNTFDTVENLFTNLYMTKQEYDKLQEYIQKMENADGLYSATKIALDFPTISVPDVTTSYKLGYIESDQESYDGQHEGYDTSHLPTIKWNDNDLVPNPGESKHKRFKLW